MYCSVDDNDGWRAFKFSSHIRQHRPIPYTHDDDNDNQTLPDEFCRHHSISVDLRCSSVQESEDRKATELATSEAVPRIACRTMATSPAKTASASETPVVLDTPDEAVVPKNSFSSVPGSAFSTPSRSTDVSENGEDDKTLNGVQYYSFSPISMAESRTMSGTSSKLKSEQAAPAETEDATVIPANAKHESTEKEANPPATETKMEEARQEAAQEEKKTDAPSVPSVAQSPSPAPAMMSPFDPADGTPRVSNQKAIITSWPSNVESMASSLNRAFDKFKDFASPYLEDTIAAGAASAPAPAAVLAAPELVDTSTESVDTKDLDTKQLARELRSSPPRPKGSLTPNREKDSSTIVSSPAHSSRSSNPKKEAFSQTTPERNPMDTAPMMRMRNPTVQDAVTEKTVQPSAPSPRSEKDYIAAKQRKWKEKIRQAERKKGKERRLLTGESKRKSRRKSRRRKQKAHSMEGCQDGILSLVESFASVRCGNMADALEGVLGEDSEDSGSEEGSESSDERLSQHVDSTTSETTTPTGSPARPSNRQEQKRHLPFVAEEPIVRKQTASPVMMNPAQVERLLRDRNFIRSFITGAREQGLEFIIHKKNRSTSMSQPRRARAFLKDGQANGNGNFTGPWLLWETEDSLSRKGVDLFDIRSLDKASALQLEQYPLAIPGRSLFLRINEGSDYVFEMKDETAALQFVHGMRWVVARLSFNLIIGNVNVTCEMLEMDVGDQKKASPGTFREESLWSRAMNDLANHLVDKSELAIKS